MKILPYENLTYKTHLSKNEIVKRLSEEIQPKHWLLKKRFSFNGKYKSYEGVINEDSFKISRVIIDSQNSFAPQIKGKIEEVNNSQNSKKTLIHIKMRLHIFIIIFMFILLLSMLLGSLVLITLKLGLAFLFPFLIIFLMSVVIIFAFNYERDKSKAFFEKLFEVERGINK